MAKMTMGRQGGSPSKLTKKTIEAGPSTVTPIVEVIKEVEKIVYVEKPVEVIVEKRVEVPVEVIVTKEVIVEKEVPKMMVEYKTVEIPVMYEKEVIKEVPVIVEKQVEVMPKVIDITDHLEIKKLKRNNKRLKAALVIAAILNLLALVVR